MDREKSKQVKEAEGFVSFVGALFPEFAKACCQRNDANLRNALYNGLSKKLIPSDCDAIKKYQLKTKQFRVNGCYCQEIVEIDDRDVKTKRVGEQSYEIWKGEENIANIKFNIGKGDYLWFSYFDKKN